MVGESTRDFKAWSGQGVCPLTLPGHQTLSHMYALTFVQLRAGPPAHRCTCLWSYSCLSAHTYIHTAIEHSHMCQFHMEPLPTRTHVNDHTCNWAYTHPSLAPAKYSTR